MEMALIILGVFAIGMWKSWSDISKGSGWLCSHFSPQTLESLNGPGGTVKKVLLAAVLSYVTIGVTIVKYAVKIGIHLVDGF